MVVMAWAFRPTPATACACIAGPYTCGYARTAAAVFAASVEAFEEHPGEMIGDFQTHERHVRLQNIQALRGTPQDVVVTDGSDCAYPFVKGARYLIVADRRPSDQRLIVSLCGLTAPLDEAAGLLDFISSLKAPANGSQVWGTVSMPARWVEFSPGYEPLANARVTLSGPVKRSMSTSADGRYRSTGLPRGKYKIHVELSKAFPYLGPVEDEDVTLGKNSCAAVDFAVPSRSHITGVVVDEHTRPQAGIFMMLRLADYHNPRTGDPGRGTHTDEDGRYMFPDLPPARYVVDVAESFSNAVARTEHGETIIDLKRGEQITMETLWVRCYYVGMLYGSVQTPAGDPVADMDVSLAALAEDTPAISNPPTKSDAQGHFMLRGWLNERYRVIAGRADSPSGQVEIVAGLGPLIVVVPPR